MILLTVASSPDPADDLETGDSISTVDSLHSKGRMELTHFILYYGSQVYSSRFVFKSCSGNNRIKYMQGILRGSGSLRWKVYIDSIICCVG